jgi:hypothetical protein
MNEIKTGNLFLMFRFMVFLQLFIAFEGCAALTCRAMLFRHSNLKPFTWNSSIKDGAKE